MPRASKDVYGFDELEKSFNKLKTKYPNSADAMLMTQGRAVQRDVKSTTPRKTGKLRRSWSLKKVKLYKGGKVRVVRIQSRAPHAHLVEYGHKIYRGGKTRRNGRKMNRVQLAVRGVKSLGSVEGKKVLEKAMNRARSRFPREAEKLLDKLVKEFDG